MRPNNRHGPRPQEGEGRAERRNHGAAWTVTERELSQAGHLKAELDALRRVASLEPSPEVLRSIDRQAKAVESARLEIMAFIAAIPEPRIRAIAVMRFLEGKSWETIARRMHYERSSPAKIMRRFLTGRNRKV